MRGVCNCDRCGADHAPYDDETSIALTAAIDTIIASLHCGGTVLCCGNGGSDAHAGHLVAELVGRFAYDRPPLRAVHLSSGGPVGSCIANDYGWEQVFARQVRALGSPGDVLVCFTTSGRSANVLAAMRAAWDVGGSDMGIDCVVLCGPNGVDTGWAGTSTAPPAPIVVRSTATGTPAIQEQHQAWVHEIARRTEEALCPR